MCNTATLISVQYSHVVLDTVAQVLCCYTDDCNLSVDSARRSLKKEEISETRLEDSQLQEAKPADARLDDVMLADAKLDDAKQADAKPEDTKLPDGQLKDAKKEDGELYLLILKQELLTLPSDSDFLKIYLTLLQAFKIYY
jgi:hypothetical protein